MSNGIRFEIVEEIGVIEKNYETGWKKELNLVSWNGKDPKYDIRDWNPEHTSMSRGVTLTESQAKKLLSLLKGALNE